LLCRPAGGRTLDTVKLVGASKTASVERIARPWRQVSLFLGENYLQEAKKIAFDLPVDGILSAISRAIKPQQR
jgi:uncharacterized pyridoxal phosphate-containing UPF0001 family protein